MHYLLEVSSCDIEKTDLSIFIEFDRVWKHQNKNELEELLLFCGPYVGIWVLWKRMKEKLITFILGLFI